MTDHDLPPDFYHWRPADQPPNHCGSVLLTIVMEECGTRCVVTGYYWHDAWQTGLPYAHTVAAWRYKPAPADVHEFDDVDDEVTS